jgi:phage shock protein C
MIHDEQKNQKNVHSTTAVRRLYRSQRGRMIGGVCGGISEYFRVDATLVRIAFIVLAFAGGWGIIAYIIGLIIIPENPEKVEEDVKREGYEELTGRGAGYVWGIVFIMAGLIFLLFNYDMLPWQLWRFWYFPWKLFWPFVIILIGVILLLSRSKRKTDQKENEPYSERKQNGRLTRSKRERMIGGVCGGLGFYFRLDPAIVRFLWVIGTIVSHGLGIVAYILLLIVLPEEEFQTEPKA